MLEVCTATMQLPPSKQQFTSSGEEWEEEENGRRLPYIVRKALYPAGVSREAPATMSWGAHVEHESVDSSIGPVHEGLRNKGWHFYTLHTSTCVETSHLDAPVGRLTISYATRFSLSRRFSRAGGRWGSACNARVHARARA